MNLTAIASVIFALAKAVPKVMDLYEKVETLILQYRLSQVTNDYKYKRDKLRAIINAISKAESKEDRSALSRVLHDYTTGKSDRMSD
jgi:hypothetical protein